ncbi:MAG TPA: peptidase M61, partial [Rhodanobacter sp.]|nr:peptidase M61 [Rhodanobacter sp.]
MMSAKMRGSLRALAFAGLWAAMACWAAPPVSPAPPVSTPTPKDVPYPGMLKLDVDLRDAPRRIYRMHETIPVQPGPLTLYYPKWPLPDHAPDGAIANIAG